MKVSDLLFGLLPVFAIGGLALLTFTEPGKRILESLGVKKAMDSIFRPSSNYVGAYAVDLRNLPYDPNNYYLPPRDTSILP